MNRRYNRWLCASPIEVLSVMHKKFLPPVVMSNEGCIMPLNFFPQGLRHNAATYAETLDTVVKPWVKEVAWQGDCQCTNKFLVPLTHWVKLWNGWLKIFIIMLLQTFGSPDLNTMGYYIWGIVERANHMHSHNIKDSLKGTMANRNKECLQSL